MRKKKALLESTVSELVKGGARFSLEEENAKNSKEMKLLLSKSNFFRKTVTKKQGKMKECQEQIIEFIKQKEKIV